MKAREVRYRAIYQQRLIYKFARENSPCFGCTTRRQNCHSDCEAGEKYEAALRHFKTVMLPEIMAQNNTEVKL